MHSKKIGIDECEIVTIRKNITTVRITDSEIAEIKQNFDENFGIRLIHNKKIASIQTTNEENISDAITKGVRTIKTLKPRDFWNGLPEKNEFSQLEGTFDEKIKQISGAEAADIAQDMINNAENKKIDTITGSLNLVYENFELNNSNGLNFNNEATYISGIINAESEQSTLPVSGIGHACGRTLSKFSSEQIGKDAKKMCINSINPKKIKHISGVEAADIAQNMINNSENKPEGIGTKSVDGEGIRTKKNTLVKNGVFINVFSNLYDSYKEGEQESSGNGIRMGSPLGNSAEPIPISAPHNLIVTPGNKSQEEMIKDTKHGLLIGRLWYTYAVNPIKGDFSCTARSGIQIIENGEIVAPGKSVRIVHNLPKLLNNITDIGNDQRRVIQWASLPSIAPSIKVENISVNSI